MKCGDCCHNLAVNVILTKKIEEVFKLLKADAASNLDVPLVVLHHHTLAGDDLGKPEYNDDDQGDSCDNDGGFDGYPIAHLLLINTLSPHLERKQNFGEMRVMSLKLMGLRPMDFFLLLSAY